jgi:hypothetical protein|tara:strand:+ start:372 stop:707 length:336 start_codon:yes stop_codon:yes gene_type:complete
LNVRVVLLAGLIFVAPAASARIYKGEEAAALRCANTLAYTAVLLSQADLIGPDETKVMLGITVLILEKHVTGTRAEKKSALAIMRNRRDVTQTLTDYQTNAAKCLVQFPIN